MHGRYQRTVRDLPIQGTRAVLSVMARKYYCDESTCARRIFCERFPGVLEPYARSTARLDQILTELALQVSARLAARLSRLLRFPASASTLLRRAARYEPPAARAVRIGIDDFAFRRGHHYGTIVIDLDTHRPIEVLPDRNAATLRAFLAERPEVEVICRDRDARYTDAIVWEVPDATVILDRWHLVRNLTDAVERTSARHHRAWTATLREYAQRERLEATHEVEHDLEDADLPWSAMPEREISPREEERQRAARQRRQDRFDRIADFAGKGLSKTEIARRLGLDRGTVASYLRQGGPPQQQRRRLAPTLLDPYVPHLAERWRNDGCRNAALLTREIRQHGYTGSVRTVKRLLRAWRRTDPPDQTSRTPPPAVQLPPPRALAWALLQDRRDEPAVELLKTLDHHAATIATLAPQGLHALQARDLHAWSDWRGDVADSTSTDLKRFLRGLERDEPAVTNALLLPYSNGPTEGAVHRIKLIKRSMYGRANFPLLRKKILHHDT